MNPNIAVALGAVAAIAGTVLAMIFVVPENKRAALPKFFQFVHDLFNFKYLIIEKILKVLYIAATVFCVVCGFFLLFSGYNYWYSGYQSFALAGLLVMILGPVAVRILFELSMMFILLLKNTMQINAKIKGEGEEKTPDVFVTPAPELKNKFVFCPRCGTRYNEAQGSCPNCTQNHNA